MNKFDLISNPLINMQPIPSSYGAGLSWYETISQFMSQLNDLIANSNLGADEILVLQEKKHNIEDYLKDMSEKRKLDENGNFTGTWNGVPMHLTSEGLASDWGTAKGNFGSVSNRLLDYDSKISNNTKNLGDISVIVGQKAEQKDLDNSILIVQNKADKTEISNLQGQINTLVLGSAGTSNAENIQARTDSLGTTHSTLDERLRAMEGGNTNLQKLSPLYNGYSKPFVSHWEVGGINGTNGADVSANYVLRSVNYIQGGHTLKLKYNLNYTLTIIRYNGNFMYLDYVVYNGNPNTEQFITLASDCYYRFSFANNTTDPINDISLFLSNLLLVSEIDKINYVADLNNKVSQIDSVSYNTMITTEYIKNGLSKPYIDYSNWEIGGINGTNGQNVIADYIVRTINYVTGVDNENLIFKIPSGYEVCIIKYNSDGSYNSYMTYQNDFVEVLSSTLKYKITIYKHNINTPITTTSDFLMKVLICSSNDNTISINTPIQGKTCNFVGDSITEQQRYVTRVVEETKVVSTGQKGLASSTIAVNNSYLTNKSICERILGVNGNTGYEDANIWTVFGGINDYYYNTPLGTITSTDNTTFYGALKSIVTGILQKSNTPQLLIMTPLQSKYNSVANTLGLYPKDYVNAIKDVCEYYSVKCIDLWSKSGLNTLNIQASTNPTTLDGLHPNDYGTSLFYKVIADDMNTLNFDYLKYVS